MGRQRARPWQGLVSSPAVRQGTGGLQSRGRGADTGEARVSQGPCWGRPRCRAFAALLERLHSMYERLTAHAAGEVLPLAVDVRVDELEVVVARGCRAVLDL